MDVILVDLDGTLAAMNGRYPYAGPEAVEDGVHQHVLDVLVALRATWDAQVFVLSGRSAEHRVWSERWLVWHGVPWDRLEMRPWGDGRPDWAVKEEIYERLCLENPNMRVRAVFDDRKSVCDMWFRRGLPLFRVGDPSSDF